MKKFAKIAAIVATSTLALTMGAFALTGCGDSGTDYIFEAETAVTEGTGSSSDGSQSVATVENNVVWTSDGNGGEEVSGLGGFNAVGQKIIWTVNAETDCSVTITIYAASALMDMDMETYNLKGLSEVNLGNTDVYAMKVNDTAVTLKGTLPATEFEGGWEGMMAPGVWWHMGTASCTAQLKAGENKIVFEIVGSASMMGSGVNVDKIVINSTVVLS